MDQFSRSRAGKRAAGAEIAGVVARTLALALAVLVVAWSSGEPALAGANARLTSCETGKPLTSARYAKCNSGRIFIATKDGCAMAATQPDLSHWSNDAASGTSRRKLSGCFALHVACVDEGNQMAHVGCDNPDDGTSSEGWINVDYLDCVPENVSTYVPPTLPTDPAGCGMAPADTIPLRTKSIKDGVDLPGALQQCMIEHAYQTYRETQEMSQGKDQYALFTHYDDLSNEDLATALTKAARVLDARLDRARKIFGPACDQTPHPKGPVPARFWTDVDVGKITCLVLLRARETNDKLAAAGSSPSEVRSRWDKLSGSAGQSKNVAAKDDRALKEIMFEGLPDTDRASFAGSLGMTRTEHEFRDIETQLGWKAGPTFEELHNGYVLGGERMGGNKNAVDCSDFISDLYGLKIGNEKPRTLQLEQIASALSAGHPERVPPPWGPLANCFVPVNLKAGERPVPGDIIVQRSHGDGHVVIVRNYDAAKDPENVETLEAYGGEAGTIAPNKRPIFEPRCPGSFPTAQPAVRPDISVLRFIDDSHCPAKPKTTGCEGL